MFVSRVSRETKVREGGEKVVVTSAGTSRKVGGETRKGSPFRYFFNKGGGEVASHALKGPVIQRLNT